MSEIITGICKKIIEEKQRFVLISGNGGAGKSTLADILKNECQKYGKSVHIISTDDFMFDKNYRKSTTIYYTDNNGMEKSGYMASSFPQSYDYEALRKVVSSCDEDITIIEGIGAAFLLEDFTPAYKIFLSIDKEMEYSRRFKRARSGADLSRERIEMRYE